MNDISLSMPTINKPFRQGKEYLQNIEKELDLNGFKEYISQRATFEKQLYAKLVESNLLQIVDGIEQVDFSRMGLGVFPIKSVSTPSFYSTFSMLSLTAYYSQNFDLLRMAFHEWDKPLYDQIIYTLTLLDERGSAEHKTWWMPERQYLEHKKKYVNNKVYNVEECPISNVLDYYEKFANKTLPNSKRMQWTSIKAKCQILTDVYGLNRHFEVFEAKCLTGEKMYILISPLNEHRWFYGKVYEGGLTGVFFEWFNGEMFDVKVIESERKDAEKEAHSIMREFHKEVIYL
jgi:hypothetical protein